MLEASQHKHNCFITLTYSDEHLPGGGSLAPEDARDWLKRFRFAIEPVKIRYYLVGEYGDQTWRPHYHVAVFGYPKCLYGMSRYNRERQTCCPICDKVRDTWGRGNILVGSLETKSAQYIAGYVQKKMTRFDDPRLKPGLHPEFCRMSLRPGIGAMAMHDVADTILRHGLEQFDVPTALRHGSKLLPLGRYLRRRLREHVGLAPGAPPEALAQLEKETLQAVQDYTGIDPRTVDPVVRKTFFKNALVDAGNQRVLNAAARADIFKQKRRY